MEQLQVVMLQKVLHENLDGNFEQKCKTIQMIDFHVVFKMKKKKKNFQFNSGEYHRVQVHKNIQIRPTIKRFEPSG